MAGHLFLGMEGLVGRDIVGSIEAEFQRYKALAEGAMDQLGEEDLSRSRSAVDNSIAALAWHISGNLTSRFSDFLSSDGEKSWRKRDSEFEARHVSRAELRAKWEDGWRILFESLGALGDEDLFRRVSIRGMQLSVHEALHRSLSHTSYHVGQIVYVSKSLRGETWNYLSIPPGASEAYNRNPPSEQAADQAGRIAAQTDGSSSS